MHFRSPSFKSNKSTKASSSAPTTPSKTPPPPTEGTIPFPSSSPSSSPKRRPSVAGMKKLVTRVRRRISSLGHRNKDGQAPGDGLVLDLTLAAATAAAPFAIPLPPSPTAEHSDGCSTHSHPSSTRMSSYSTVRSADTAATSLRDEQSVHEKEASEGHGLQDEPIAEEAAEGVFEQPSPVPESVPEPSDEQVAEESSMGEERPEPVAEPEVPDPFLVDDPEQPLSSEEEEEESLAVSSGDDDTPADEIALAQSTILETPVATASVNKPVPPTPSPEPPVSSQQSSRDDESSSSSEEEDSAPDLFLPSLILPTMFLALPNVRICLPVFASPLTWWLTRSVTSH
ncbi:hypothetical protein K474DRAFT_1428020 [Panus rudis PR-1116 ss-1]|nr:hypothetical protein K474DRAFT_1428020 [Panus rudis PR-1116 ss-1]